MPVSGRMLLRKTGKHKQTRHRTRTRIGILGEEVKKNGAKLLEVIDETDLVIMNLNKKCEGKITRKNTKKEHEISAIDFVLASHEAESWIQKMNIDELGLLKLIGKNESDHNTMTIDINVPCLEKTLVKKTIKWNLKASSEKWTAFANKIEAETSKATDIITNKDEPIDTRYRKWFQIIENAARRTIGKTTIKDKKSDKPTEEMEIIICKKKKMKNEIQEEKNEDAKLELIQEYKNIQEILTEHRVRQKTAEITAKFEKIVNDKSRISLWDEKRRMTKNHTLDYLIVRDPNGQKQFHPDGYKQTTANYYEGLFKRVPFQPHPYHDEVKKKMVEYKNDYQYDSLDYNQTPSIEEVKEIINNKQNNKSTPDLPNELLKRPGNAMVKFIYPLVTTTFDEGKTPKIFNKGTITSLWKGKGSKEDLSNHRGITTSSSIGTILDSIIDHRIEALVPYSQAQGGGQKGYSTCDHLFILRAIIDLSIKRKTPTFITYWDVSKAYDHVDNEDLMVTMWENGLRGKTWRILNELNSNLTAEIKTRYGLTREIEMEIGGKQGSRLTGRMFSKMMDTMATELSGMGIKITEEILIAVLLWVDDVVSFAEGEAAQNEILQAINEFAIKYKIKWGESKCRVMRVGKHTQKSQTWQVGDMNIQETVKYKYLGDIITPDGKNKENILDRKNKIQSATMIINSIAASEVLCGIETAVLLDLHEKKNVTGLLTNAESWKLNKGEEEEIERVELQALKSMFALPLHLPTPAIIFSLGTLLTKQRIDKKMLIYLHKILNKMNGIWLKEFFMVLVNSNTGWFQKIKENLKEYELPEDFEEIRKKTIGEWKCQVSATIERKNKDRLLQMCLKNDNSIQVPKTKTETIVKKLESDHYKRGPESEFLKMTKNETKTVMIA